MCKSCVCVCVTMWRENVVCVGVVCDHVVCVTKLCVTMLCVKELCVRVARDNVVCV